jgi:hypothetical protein
VYAIFFNINVPSVVLYEYTSALNNVRALSLSTHTTVLPPIYASCVPIVNCSVSEVLNISIILCDVVVLVTNLSPDTPVGPVAPVGPVCPVVPVGPSIPSKLTLYTTF